MSGDILVIFILCRLLDDTQIHIIDTVDTVVIEGSKAILNKSEF